MPREGVMAGQRVLSINRNPDGVRDFERFHRNRLLLMTRDQSRVMRRTVQEPGTIRRLWSRVATYVGGAPEFSWTANAFDAQRGAVGFGGSVSTPLRYLISTHDTTTGGNLRSDPMLRPAVPPSVAAPSPPLVLGGNVQNRPTVRSRIPSFGSRIPALNSPVPGGIE